jgi:aspartyl-tRNA(Asn)/glutamyl-tRNA(Gln) amidotransferase subunit C
MPKKRDEIDIGAAVQRMAKLARLSFDEDSLAALERKARAVIGYFDELNEVDTEGIEPTSHAVSVEQGLRADEVRPSGVESALIDEAPDRDGPYVQVPRVIEGE